MKDAPRNKRVIPKTKRGKTTRPFTGLTPKKIEEFCEVLSRGYSIAAACRKIGCSREYAYTLRKKNAEFAAAWDHAIENGSDSMEDRLNDIGNSNLPGNVTAIIFHLKGRRPEKYRERSDVTNSDGSIVNAFAEAMMQHGTHSQRSGGNETNSA